MENENLLYIGNLRAMGNEWAHMIQIDQHLRSFVKHFLADNLNLNEVKEQGYFYLWDEVRSPKIKFYKFYNENRSIVVELEIEHSSPCIGRNEYYCIHKITYYGDLPKKNGLAEKIAELYDYRSKENKGFTKGFTKPESEEFKKEEKAKKEYVNVLTTEI